MSATVTNMPELLADPRVFALVQDEIEESLVAVEPFNKLASLHNRAFAMEHYMWTEDAYRTAILCQRDGSEEEEEATFLCSGVVARYSAMPYETFQDFNPNPRDNLVPGGHQYIAMIGPDLPVFAQQLEAVRNLDVMARLRRAEGKYRAMSDSFVDGCPALVPSTPISTPRSRLIEGDELLTLVDDQDPRGIVTQWVNQRGHAIVADNQVDIFMTCRDLKEGVGHYERANDNAVAGATLRAGQLVRCEVGFRIVPAGQQYMMRMVLKSVEIINANVSWEIAFKQADAEKESGERPAIYVSSAGPSGLTIKEKSKVKRVRGRKQNHQNKGTKSMSLGELPFAPK